MRESEPDELLPVWIGFEALAALAEAFDESGSSGSIVDHLAGDAGIIRWDAAVKTVMRGTSRAVADARRNRWFATENRHGIAELPLSSDRMLQLARDFVADFHSRAALPGVPMQQYLETDPDAWSNWVSAAATARNAEDAHPQASGFGYFAPISIPGTFTLEDMRAMAADDDWLVRLELADQAQLPEEIQLVLVEEVRQEVRFRMTTASHTILTRRVIETVVANERTGRWTDSDPATLALLGERTEAPVELKLALPLHDVREGSLVRLMEDLGLTADQRQRVREELSGIRQSWSPGNRGPTVGEAIQRVMG